MPRYVLLKHTLPEGPSRATHWDFMLEDNGVLRTWALDAEPESGVLIAATQLADHRLAYLDYEGAVSGDRGSVERVDRGEYALTENTAAHVDVILSNGRFLGTAALKREEGDQRWRFVFVADAALGAASS